VAQRPDNSLLGRTLAPWREKIRERFAVFANRVGFSEIRGLLIVIVVVIAVAALLAGMFGGVVAGGGALVGSICVVIFWLVTRMQRRRRAIVRQLPSFLDGIVRLVTLGNSVPAAFQQCLQGSDPPLRGCLDQCSRMLRAGVEVDRAMLNIAELYKIKEFELVGSVLRLAVKYGGRADVMLERMSVFMRDLEAAERELMAMTAETRLSAWILGLLPVGVACFMVASTPHLFAQMWDTGSGRNMIYLAFLLQIAGSVMLYRMTSLK
jgi:tight adherence protein B